MEDRDKNTFSIGCLCLLALVVVAVLVTFGFLAYGLSSGRLASTAALPQNKIPKNQLSEIARIVNLRPNEKVLYFYSATMTVSGDGNLFTDGRVISYTNDEGPLQVFDADYAEIKDVTFHPSDSWLDDSTITITLLDETTFDLWVSNESGRDKTFYDRLVQEWKRHGNP